MKGRRVGAYVLEECLGRGGMGEVYRGYDARLDRHVALKQVRSDRARPSSQQRLRHEARSLARLAHPSIVPVFDIVSTDEGDWMVMELVDGNGLDQLLESGPLSEKRALSFAAQIADALRAAHASGILHRDLKSANVMITASDRVRLLDFGLAKAAQPGKDHPHSHPSSLLPRGDSPLSLSGQLIGTVHAMSPEQARGLPLDARSDLFSLGTLLYEMTTGERPFAAAEPVATLLQICKHRQAPVHAKNPRVPIELSRLIDRLLEKAPDMRPATADETAQLLQTMLANTPDSSGPTASRREGAADLSRTSSGSSTRDDTVADDALMIDHVVPPPAEPTAAMRPAPQGAPPPSATRARLRNASWMSVAMALVTIVLVTTIGWRISTSAQRSETPQGMTEDPRTTYATGMTYLRRPDLPGNIDHAIRLFEAMIASVPASAAAHAGLARALWENVDDPAHSNDPSLLERAERMAQEAVRLDPYLVDARISRALVSLAKDQQSRAESDLAIARELEPDNGDTAYALGRLASRRAQPESEEAAYREAIRLAPDWRVPYDHLGTLLYRLGRYEEAEAAFRSSIAIAPDNLYGIRNLAGVAFARGDLEQAAYWTQEALTLRPDASLYSNLGTILFAQGSYLRAAEAFEAALALPGSADVFIYWANLADAYRQLPGQADRATEHYAEAVRLISEALEKRPDDAGLFSRRAVFEARAGNLEAARRDLSHLADEEIRDGYSLLRIAISQELTGLPDRAVQTLAMALDAGLDMSEIEVEIDLAALRERRAFRQLLSN